MRPLALALAACLLAASPALARPDARVSDATGDWPVASQDIVGVNVTTVRVDGRPAVRAVVTFAAAPDPLAEYGVTLDTRCDSWSLLARGTDARLERRGCDTLSEPTTAAATVAVQGNTLVLTAPYALGLAKGLRVANLSATASPYLTGLYVGSGTGQDGFVATGDLAFGKVSYVLP